MIRRWFIALPGPVSVKAVLAAMIVLLALIGLLFVYDWIGSNLLDTGGVVG